MVSAQRTRSSTRWPVGWRSLVHSSRLSARLSSRWAVAVMDLLVGVQRPAEQLAHDQDVLVHPTQPEGVGVVGPVDADVAAAVLVAGGAGLAAPGVGLDRRLQGQPAPVADVVGVAVAERIVRPVAPVQAAVTRHAG